MKKKLLSVYRIMEEFILEVIVKMVQKTYHFQSDLAILLGKLIAQIEDWI